MAFSRAPRSRACWSATPMSQRLNQTTLDADVYNLAAPGDSLREGYAKLRYVLGRPTHIRQIYLSVDLHMFGTGRLRSANGAFADQYLVLSNSPYGLDKGRLGGLLNAVPLFNDDFVQFTRARIRVTLARKPSVTDKPPELPWFDLSETERAARARRTGDGDHNQVGRLEEPFLWIGRIVALARAHDATVIGVRYPAHRRLLRNHFRRRCRADGRSTCADGHHPDP